MKIRFKEFRLKNKLSQLEVANYLDVGQSTYSHYEIGRTQPTLEMLIKLANLYKTTVDELIGNNVPYLINKIDFTSEQLALIDKIKSLNGNQCNQISAYIDGVKDGKK